MKKLSLGLDLGGTNIKAALLSENGEIVRQATRPTGSHAAAEDEWQWKSAVRSAYLDLKNEFGDQIAAVGISAPGLANADNSAVHCMPGRLFGLEHFNWSDYFGERVWVLNDAHSALMAEARFGAAKDFRNVVLLTLGTGVGGGILINGELHQGLFQVAGHFGHTTVNALDDEPDITAMPGSLEDAIGNHSIGRRSQGRFNSTYELLEAYRRGDYFATWLWLHSVRKLGVAIASISNALSPELFVLGGGIIKAGDDLLKPLREFVDMFEWQPAGKRSTIVAAHFEEFAGAIGAAGFAWQKKFHQ